ncbi:MAG: DUF4242 domain-containing protein [Gammaproteobacteria bacterium]
MALFLIERNFVEEQVIDPESEFAGQIREVNDDVGIRWIYSYLSADKRKTYCLYEAPDPEAIREAARRLDLPADVIIQVDSPIGPQGAVQVA